MKLKDLYIWELNLPWLSLVWGSRLLTHSHIAFQYVIWNPSCYRLAKMSVVDHAKPMLFDSFSLIKVI